MTSSLMTIERPHCPRCRTRMMLARVSPASDSKEKRVFECPKCNFMDTVTVSDPLESRSTGWLLGELRPPEAHRGNAVTHDIRDGRMIPKPAK
jgi:transposase-like protein